jgi:hypothetical protein
MRTRSFHIARAGVLLALLAAPALAQTNEEKLEKKMAKPFVSNITWETDYDKAREKAKAENKLIFAYFTRSYSP